MAVGGRDLQVTFGAVDLPQQVGAARNPAPVVDREGGVTVKQPIHADLVLGPHGPGLGRSRDRLYNHNFRNKDTDYKSGGEVNVDYSLGWGLGNGVVLGVGGHWYRQVGDDKVGGVPVGTDGNRGRSFSIGPSLKYDSDKGWFVTAKWQKESGVRNKAEGDALWIKAVFPL